MPPLDYEQEGSQEREREREREEGGGPLCDTPPVLLPTNSQFRSENSEQTLHVKLSKTIGIKRRDDIGKKRMKRPFFAEVSGNVTRKAQTKTDNLVRLSDLVQKSQPKK